MPGGDRTGPLGQGPMSGRGAGYCAGYGRPGAFSGGFGRGRGMGPGRGRGVAGRGFGGGGRGWRNMYQATGMPGWMRGGWQPTEAEAGPGPEDERRWLGREAEALEGRLREIQRRLEDIAPADKTEPSVE